MQALSERVVEHISELAGPEWSGESAEHALLATEEFCVVRRIDYKHDDYSTPWGRGIAFYKEALFLCWDEDGEIAFEVIIDWGDFVTQTVTVRRKLPGSVSEGEEGISISVEGHYRSSGVILTDKGWSVRKHEFSFRWPRPKKPCPEKVPA